MAARSVSMISAASNLAENEWVKRRYQWPYPWVYPPLNASFVNYESPDSGGTGIPPTAYGPANAVALLTYTVPDGFFFVLNGLLATVGGGTPLADGSGQYIWNLSVNVPTQVAGITLPGLANGYAVQNLQGFSISKGSNQRPWPINNRIFEPRDVLSLSVQTANPFPTSLPTLFLSGFYGWTWPEEDDEAVQAIRRLSRRS